MKGKRGVEGKGIREDKLSEMEEVRGTEPVRRTTIIPRVRSVTPSDLEKYSSSSR